MSSMGNMSKESSSSYLDDEPQVSIEQQIASEKIFSREMIMMLEKVFKDRVKAVVPSMNFSTSAPLMAMGEEIYPTVKVVENGFFAVKDAKVARGTLFTEIQIQNAENVVIITADLVEVFKNRDPIGKTIFINNTAFIVTGILEKSNDYSLSRSVFLPFVTVEKRFGSQKIESISVYTHTPDQIESVQKDLGYFLMKYSGAYSPFEVNFNLYTNKKWIEQFMQGINQIALFVSGIAGISLLVGGIGIMNIMLVSVTERTREIGIRKAIGARRRDIIFQFLTESAILSLIGGVVAIIFSYVVGKLIHAVVDKINPIMTLDIIILATSFSMFMGIVFGLLPAWKAAKMDAIEALRFE